jgi:hypothetical protein
VTNQISIFKENGDLHEFKAAGDEDLLARESPTSL